MVGLDVEFGFQWLHEGLEHVEQHALATGGDDIEHGGIDDGCENDRLVAVNDTGVVDLAHRLQRLVDTVDEGQTDVAGWDFKLGQDGVAKGFGGDAGAVRNEKYGAIGHGGRL